MVWLGHGAFFVGVSFGVRLTRVEMPHTAFGVGSGSGAPDIALRASHGVCLDSEGVAFCFAKVPANSYR